MVQNKSLIFKDYPEGDIQPGKDIAAEDRALDLDNVELDKDGLLTQNLFVSIDPYQRNRMKKVVETTYTSQYRINEPITNFGLARVVKSANAKFAEGDVIHCDELPAQQYSVLDAKSTAVQTAWKIDNKYDLPLRYFAGPLSMTGMTAFSSYYELADAKKGETIFISAASGAVGQVVGQLAKREGLTVIGSVGDDAKAEYITKTLSFDHAFNYKKEKPGDALKRLAPHGIDIYYENVGGEHLEAAINTLNKFGRVVVCGMISQYQKKPEDAYPIRNLGLVVGKRLRIQGFIQADFWPKYIDRMQREMQQWIHDGSLKVVLDESKGVENGAQALNNLFSGKNFGKTVLNLHP